MSLHECLYSLSDYYCSSDATSWQRALGSLRSNILTSLSSSSTQTMQDSAAAPLLTSTASALISARATTTFLRRNSTEPILHIPKNKSTRAEHYCKVYHLVSMTFDWLLYACWFSLPLSIISITLSSGTFLIMIILRANWREYFFFFFLVKQILESQALISFLIGSSICASDTWPTVHVL